MNDIETIDLIKGTFTPEEAKELLMGLLTGKINFHNLKNWSSKERFGKPDSFSEQKPEYLRKAKEELDTFLAEAKDQQKI